MSRHLSYTKKVLHVRQAVNARVLRGAGPSTTLWPMSEAATEPDQLQVHLVLPYNIEARRDVRVKGYLSRGYRIVELQRISDREVLITFARQSPAAN